ncbi:MAG TPA: ferritin-like domain-containing protein [Gemmata sp.]
MTTDAGHEDLLLKVVSKLRQAAEIEQQFMCMYLYGAFSIQKRFANHQRLPLSPAQLELTRRWASIVYSVARQEMEHLAIVNNLLRSIGAAPYFARVNLSEKPLAGFHLGAEPLPGEARATRAAEGAVGGTDCTQLLPVPHDFRFDRFDFEAARRWTCMEAANCETLLAGGGDHFADWCFARKSAQPAAAPPGSVEPGTIQDLYHELEELVAQLPDTAFVNGAGAQVTIEQQYDIYVFPVTDHASARQAMRLITEQGEGTDAPPTYPSHYYRFYDIVREWERPENRPLLASWDVLPNPHRDQIQIPYTKRVYELFNDAYETLLIMLTGLYATQNQNPAGYPYFGPALGMEAFAPFMTMVIRSLAEVLVQLRATDGQNGKAVRVGPGFEISPQLGADLRQPYSDGPHGLAGRNLKPQFANIDEITRRVEALSENLRALIESHEKAPVVEPELADWVQQRMQYIQANAQRIAINLRRIYQQNVFSGFQTVGY